MSSLSVERGVHHPSPPSSVVAGLWGSPWGHSVLSMLCSLRGLPETWAEVFRVMWELS